MANPAETPAGNVLVSARRIHFYDLLFEVLIQSIVQESVMASVRAELVAEVLWELKKINKLATYTEIAQRAGFKPGANGKTILTSLDAVKRDWPHLQWWRALPDDFCLDRQTPHVEQLQANGFTMEDVKGKKTGVTIVDLRTSLYSWEDDPTATAAVVPS